MHWRYGNPCSTDQGSVKHLDHENPAHSLIPTGGMGGAGQLKSSSSDAGTQLRVGAIRPWNNNSDIGHLEQRQIVRRISQSQDLHLLSTQMSLQGCQGLAFADVRAQQMPHAIALHHREMHPLR